MIYKSMLDLIGNTPIVELTKIKEKYGLYANIYAKLEMFNPTGSIKDRIAKNILEDAINKGKINKDTLIIEATSGNTGIGLAFVCLCLGLRFLAVMPENMSIERRQLIKVYGGELILIPKEQGMKGCIEKIKEIKEKTENVFVVSQFENEINPLTHENTTGKEIYQQMNGNIDIVVCGIGTGGTITGIGKCLKKRCNSKVVGVEPKSSPLISKGIVGEHKIEGIGANFISNVLDLTTIDEIITISDIMAYYGMRMLKEEEGIFAGISSGAVFIGALEMAKKIENKDKNIVILLSDTGERYLKELCDVNE